MFYSNRVAHLVSASRLDFVYQYVFQFYAGSEFFYNGHKYSFAYCEADFNGEHASSIILSNDKISEDFSKLKNINLKNRVKFVDAFHNVVVLKTDKRKSNVSLTEWFKSYGYEVKTNLPNFCYNL